MNAIFGILRYRNEGPEGLIDMRQMPGGTTVPAGGGAVSATGTRGRSKAQNPACHIARDASCTVVADARLDDRDTLCAALDVPAPARAAIRDQALILRAWRRWGRACPNHLLGDYAFAVWDPQTRTLFCARDHIGCRPFYYALTPAHFVFASTVETVLAAPGISDEPDERMIASYLSQFSTNRGPHTFFRMVRKLLPGHACTIAAARSSSSPMRVERYWHPERTPKAAPAGDDEYAAELLRLTARAVEDRLRGGPVGVHLSGGLDSSGIAALAARELHRAGGSSPPAFSRLRPLGDEPPAPRYAPEYAAIDQVAAREGLRVRHCQTVSPDDWVALFRHHTDLRFPIKHPVEENVLRSAAQQGLSVLLSGLGGDEGVSFNGRGYYTHLLLRGRWRRLAAECRTGEKDWMRVMARCFLELVDPRLFRYLATKGRRGWRSSFPDGYWLISPAFAQRVRPLPDARNFRELGVAHYQRRLWRHGSFITGMEHNAVNGRLHGIEYRYPLLDRRLLEFALSLPPEQFRHGRHDRWVMRRAFRSVLPPEVCWRPKDGGPAQIEPMRGAFVRALPRLRQEVAAHAKTASRACYVDVPRLLESLDEAHFRTRPWGVPIMRALTVLDF